MFDIGFAELLIIGVVALLVIGPERLPEAIRTGSAWLNRLRRGFNDIKQEVQQELHNDAVLRDLRESGEKLRPARPQFNAELREDLRRRGRTAATSGRSSRRNDSRQARPLLDEAAPARGRGSRARRRRKNKSRQDDRAKPGPWREDDGPARD
jgi:sec-independent protein translocase protein TatB